MRQGAKPMMDPSFIAAYLWRSRDLLDEAARERQIRQAMSQAKRARDGRLPFSEEPPAQRFLAWLHRRTPRPLASGPGEGWLSPPAVSWRARLTRLRDRHLRRAETALARTNFDQPRWLRREAK